MAFQINIGDWKSKPSALTRLHSVKGGDYSKLRQCRWKLIKLCKESPACDAYFRSLPNGRTLTSLVNDSDVWVSLVEPCPFNYGESFETHKAIGVTALALLSSREQLFGTLIHEFAHINGVGSSGHAAELALFACGMGSWKEFLTGIDDPDTPYDPTIDG
ncbi:hypothetical protein [Labrenzia sp. DG1229]|uniref:hypothetical protein n=1 Tax=Labrenzia sp. DG1229 TaxID=681847 RepID=UPI000490A6C4|nr:hypothetical protein [Labrenzia sp. DG1229]